MQTSLYVPQKTAIMLIALVKKMIHVGSGSSLIACHNTNHKYVGFEIDETYYKLAKERIDRETAQMNIFQFI